MFKHFLILSFFAMPFMATAQNVYANPENRKIIKTECGNKILDRIETPPSLNITADDYANKIETYLKSKNALTNDQKISIKFVVTSSGNIIGVSKEEGSYAAESILFAAISENASAWKAGMVKGKAVCSYKHIEIKVKDNKVKIDLD